MSTAMTHDEAQALGSSAATAFSPRTPISTQALFAGRWTQMEKIGDTVAQIGLHAVIFGERGVGKTSLTHVISPLLQVLDAKEQGTDNPEPRIVVRINANSTDSFSSLWVKVLDEISWYEDRPTMGFAPPQSPQKERVTLRDAFGISEAVSIDDVRRILGMLKGSVFIFDEFDRLPRRHNSAFTDLIKSLSDAATQSTIVLVGVAETVDELMRDHASIGRALVQIHMPRMNERELAEIISNAEASLDVAFEEAATALIIRMSQGLPHFTHLLGLHAVRSAARRRSRDIVVADIQQAFRDAVTETDQTVTSAYNKATQSAQPGARYAQVLFAAAIAAYVSSDSLGFFQPANLVTPMSAILGRPVGIATFNQHLTHFTEDKRAAILERVGRERAYRFRFAQPLVPPYVIMRSIRDGLVTSETVERLLSDE